MLDLHPDCPVCVCCSWQASDAYEATLTELRQLQLDFALLHTDYDKILEDIRRLLTNTITGRESDQPHNLQRMEDTR